MKKLFIIEDIFNIEGKGTVAIGIPEIKESDVIVGSAICVKRAGSSEIDMEVLEKELLRNCWSPKMPRPLALLISRDCLAESIPRGSEAWLKDECA